MSWQDTLIAIVFGWPGVLVAWALAVWGIFRQQCRWLFVAAILSAPFSWYVGHGFPVFWLFPFLYLLICLMLRQKRQRWAIFLLLVAAAMLLALGLSAIMSIPAS